MVQAFKVGSIWNQPIQVRNQPVHYKTGHFRFKVVIWTNWACKPIELAAFGKNSPVLITLVQNLPQVELLLHVEMMLTFLTPLCDVMKVRNTGFVYSHGIVYQGNNNVNGNSSVVDDKVEKS